MGVSAAAEGTSWALKNGWLPRSTTGLWVVNSIGRVTVDGADRLVAVLSDGTASLAEGISPGGGDGAGGGVGGRRGVIAAAHAK